MPEARQPASLALIRGPQFAAATAMTQPNSGARPKTLLFVDVDGTFLHDSESDQTRIDRLGVLLELASVVFVSSRTVPELHRWSRRLGFGGDFIAENGAFTVVRCDQLAACYDGPFAQLLGADGLPWFLHGAGAPAAEIVEQADRTLAETGGGGPFTRRLLEAGRRGRRASLRLPASLARTAAGSEAVARLRSGGLKATVGGRWLTIWNGPDKGEAVRRYAAARCRLEGAPSQLAAAGNADNDAPMLAVVEHKWAFPDPTGGYPATLANVPGVGLLPPGPAEGWAVIVGELASIKEGRS